jgi:hypothetical protein
MLDKLPQCRQRISLPAEGIDLHFLSALDHVRFIQRRMNAMIGTAAKRAWPPHGLGAAASATANPSQTGILMSQKQYFDDDFERLPDPQRRVLARSGGNAVREARYQQRNPCGIFVAVSTPCSYT